MNRKKILAISGSTKSKSSSLSILKFIQNTFQDKIDLKIYHNLSGLPHFNPELESELPNSVIELRKEIEEAEGLLFCTPEYVYSLPGSLKNLIEWNVSTVLFANKPVAIIVAAASGQKAFQSLELILKTIESKLPDDSMLLIQGAKGKITGDATVNDQSTIIQISKVVESLMNSIE